MERNKFEEQINERLQEREIKPSDGAWDRISKQLEVSETPRPKRFRWYGIAAGFIGILFVSVLYFTLKAPSPARGLEVTDVNQETKLLHLTPDSTQEKLPDDNAITVDTAREEGTIGGSSPLNSNTTITDALVNAKNNERKVEKVTVSWNTPEQILDTKIAQIVAQVEVLEKDNATVTDAEIDSLLRSAQQEIWENKILRKDRSVDATALLADVEDELDQSFRDQIFDALKDGFLKVRTAVADRNK